MKDQVIIEKLEEVNLYLLLQVGTNKNERLVFVSLPCSYHLELLEKYKESFKDAAEKLKVIGGGTFVIEQERKRITNYCNASLRFGGCPPDKVENLLKQRYPDYSIEQII